MEAMSYRRKYSTFPFINRPIPTDNIGSFNKINCTEHKFTMMFIYKIEMTYANVTVI